MVISCNNNNNYNNGMTFKRKQKFILEVNNAIKVSYVFVFTPEINSAKKKNSRVNFQN